MKHDERTVLERLGDMLAEAFRLRPLNDAARTGKDRDFVQTLAGNRERHVNFQDGGASPPVNCPSPLRQKKEAGA
jgi:hypothetical protein